MKALVFITDYGFADIEIEKSIFRKAGLEVRSGQCKTAEDVLSEAGDAEALLVQWAPISAAVINGLPNCKVIVRYGIGTDNVDLLAAKEKGITVCNVPDYCVQEVADHTLAFVLAIGRQLKGSEALMRAGTWQITPPRSMPPFREMVFATAGFGRIARAVLERAAVFGFSLAAYDPFVDHEEMATYGVKKVQYDELIERSDVLSLHLPLTENTRAFINRENLQKMKTSAILINTSRGGLIDTIALSEALQGGRLAGVGLDVYEREPLPKEHPLFDARDTILSSHTAWYSEKSGKELQHKAAEEVVRSLTHGIVNNRVV